MVRVLPFAWQRDNGGWVAVLVACAAESTCAARANASPMAEPDAPAKRSGFFPDDREAEHGDVVAEVAASPGP